MSGAYQGAVANIRAGQSADKFLKSNPEFADPSRIKWSSSLISELERRKQLEGSGFYTASAYRPFAKQHVYFDSQFNHRTYQLPSMFPTPKHENIGLVVAAAADRAKFAVIATNQIIDLNFWGVPGQFFPRFTWSKVDDADGGLFAEGSVVKQSGETSAYGEIGEVVDGYVRVDNVTDEIKALYRQALGADISGDDISTLCMASCMIRCIGRRMRRI